MDDGGGITAPCAIPEFRVKRCARCGDSKPESNFHKDSRRQDGRRCYCAPCAVAITSSWNKQHRPKLSAYAKTRRAISDQYHRSSWANRIRKTYGITVEDYARLLYAQGFICAICGISADLDVDHCHETGRVRGLLCNRCNNGLGRFRSDTDLLLAAVEYIKQSG